MSRKNKYNNKYHKPPVRLGWVCPHCKKWSTIKKQRAMSPLSQEIGFRCENIDCGHTYVGVLEIVRTISPSACPDPSVNLPLSTHVQRELIGELLTSAPMAAGGSFDPEPPRTLELFRGEPAYG